MNGPVKLQSMPSPSTRRPSWTPFELATLVTSVLLILSPVLALAYTFMAPRLTIAQTGPDLRVSTVASSLTGAGLATVIPNQEFYYEIRVQTSSTTEVNLTLTDVFPPSVSAVAITDRSGGECTLHGAQLTCSLSATSQRPASVLVRARVAQNAAAGSQIRNVVNVRSGTLQSSGSSTITVGTGVQLQTIVPATVTPTALPSTPTATAAPPTATAVPPTPTNTATAVPPTPTATTVPPTATATAEATATTGPTGAATSPPAESTIGAETATSEPDATDASQGVRGTAVISTPTPTSAAAGQGGGQATATTQASPQVTNQPAGPTVTSQPAAPSATSAPAGSVRSQATATRADAAGGKEPPSGTTRDTEPQPNLGDNLPATSGGSSTFLWLAPLAGLALLLRTARIRRERKVRG